MNLRLLLLLQLCIGATSSGFAQRHDTVPRISAYIAWVDSVHSVDTAGRIMKTKHKEFSDQSNTILVGLNAKTGERVDGNSPFTKGSFFVKDLTASSDRSQLFRHEFRDRDSVRVNGTVFYYKDNKIVYGKVWRQNSAGDTTYLREEFYVGRSTVMGSEKSGHLMSERRVVQAVHLRKTGEAHLEVFLNPKEFERKIRKQFMDK